MNRFVSIALLAVAVLALLLRCFSLEHRPLHNDEAVNGYKFGELWRTGEYKYDPDEHHGPSLYYATAALGWLTGGPEINSFSEARLRAVTVLFGVGLIALFPLLIDGLGRRATIWAAVFIALSPAMVYYSRYFIHEMLLIFATLLALGAGWRYWRTRRIGWAILAGVGIGLMDATKETFVITLAAAAVGLAGNQIWNRWLDASGAPIKARPLNYWHLGAGLAAWLVVAIILFTSFFTNASGPLDSIRTYEPWLKRAGGDSPHIHPWYFYLHRLLFFKAGNGPFWTEALIIILAIIGAVAGFLRRKLGRANASFVRFLAIYTVAVMMAYTIISYKTPWCLLNFLLGMILLAGVGAAFLLRSIRVKTFRAGLFLLLTLGCAHLGWQGWALNFRYAADQRNPYVYAHTSQDLLRLVGRIEQIAIAAPDEHDPIYIISPGADFWPLPWYLRSYRTGWWSELPADPYAPMMIVSARLHAGLDEQGTHLMVGYFQMRPQEFFELYVKKELWIQYLDKNPPKPDPE